VLAATFDAPTLITTGVIIMFAMILGYRLINCDPNVRRSRWGIFVERDHFDEDETWTVDPLPPPAPPPSEAETKITWPEREEP
jgi:hypothetical protein